MKRTRIGHGAKLAAQRLRLRLGRCEGGKACADLEFFVHFIRYPRSSHMLLGKLLNAHPEAVIVLELNVLHYVQRSFTREAIAHLLIRKDH